MYRLYRGVFQGAIKGTNYFLGYRMPEYYFGRGASENLPRSLRTRMQAKLL